VSTEVDVDLLNKCFELKPYTFLHKVKKKEDAADDETSIASDRFLSHSNDLSYLSDTNDIGVLNIMVV
jgi:hypothetical protein